MSSYRISGPTKKAGFAIAAIIALSLIAASGAWAQKVGAPSIKPKAGASAGTASGSGTSSSSSSTGSSASSGRSGTANTISGVVTDADGKPVSGAKVEAHAVRTKPRASDAVMGSATTNASGKYVITDRTTPVGNLPSIYIEVFQTVGGKKTSVFKSDPVPNADVRKGIVIDASLGEAGEAAPAQAGANSGTSGGTAKIGTGNASTGPGKAGAVTVAPKVSAAKPGADIKGDAKNFMKLKADKLIEGEMDPWPKGYGEKLDLSKISGSSYLGWGYDVTGAYGNSDACITKVLDVNKLNDDLYLQYRPVGKSLIEEFSGTETKEVTKDMAGAIGIKARYACFSGETNITFGKKTAQSNAYSFFRSSKIFTEGYLNIPQDYYYLGSRDPNEDPDEYTYRGVNIGVLKHYLLPNAKTAIESMDPNKLFHSFGTYVLVGLAHGARIDYSYWIRTSQYSESKDFSIATAAKVSMGIASASVKAKFENTTAEAQSNSSSDKKVTTVGGDQNLITAEDDTRWRESIRGAEKFCGFLPNSEVSMVPIWLFAKTDARKKQLEEYYTNGWNEAQFEQLIGSPPQSCIVDLKVVVVKNGTKVLDEDNDGFKLLPADVNLGTGDKGTDIWIYYKEGLDNSPDKITGIYIWDESHPEYLPRGEGTIVPGGHLNQGSHSGGDKLWLCYTRGGSKPIRAICVMNLSKEDGSTEKFGMDNGGKVWRTGFSDGAGKNMNWKWVCPTNTPAQGVNLNKGADDGNRQWLGYSTDYVAPEVNE